MLRWCARLRAAPQRAPWTLLRGFFAGAPRVAFAFSPRARPTRAAVDLDFPAPHAAARVRAVAGWLARGKWALLLLCCSFSALRAVARVRGALCVFKSAPRWLSYSFFFFCLFYFLVLPLFP